MTIVCTTDFSEAAADAVAVAAGIARKRGEKLLLWHSVTPQLGDPVGPYMEPIRTECVGRLEAQAEPLRRTRLEVETEVVVGYPDRELPTRMPYDATLIVAGAHGHARGTHWLVGSVVERFARIATVPLLVVREPVTLHHWIDGRRKLNVVVATDLSAVADFALRRAALLAGIGPCDVELLYVEYPPGEHARLGISGPVSVHHAVPLVEEVLTSELARRAETVKLGGDVSTRIARTPGQTGALIALEAEEAQADLVVVGAHQRRTLARMWHGSIAHGVLHSAETNVLIVPFHTADEDLRALESSKVATIVAATDFTSAGNRAVALAMSLAPRGARVVIVNVAKRDEDAEASARALERVKAAVQPAEGTRVETIAAAGKDVAATICATGERFGADLIVVGRHTRSRVTQRLLGSVSGEVLSRSRRPVVVAPDPAV